MNTPAYRHASIESMRTILSAGQTVRLMVSGSSMEPVLKPGDAIVIQSLQSDKYRRGDILSVAKAGDIVTHRMIRMSAGRVILKGDSSPWLDEAIPFSDVLGRVVELERDGRLIQMTGDNWKQVNGFLGWAGELEFMLASAIFSMPGINKIKKFSSVGMASLKGVHYWIISLATRLWKC